MAESVSFTINGKLYNVSASTVPIETTLNTFLRLNANLRGTKFMCLEGGCGACIVNVKSKHPVDKEIITSAVNSCLTPVFSCHGYEITTIEGLGNRKDGYHEIQNRLAKFNGSQCGYCSPGMVMNMFSLLEANEGNVTMADVENSFGGNICRCTGYRPILDAFKSMACDASQSLLDRCADIEDLGKICPRSGQACGGVCFESTEKSIDANYSDQLKILGKDDKEWRKVSTLSELFECLEEIGGKEYQYSAGNTAHGVYRRSPNVQVYIDIKDIEVLRSHLLNDDCLMIGGGVTLTETMSILSKAAEYEGFEYFQYLVSHIDLIANVPVRNVGTLAGNLSIKHQHFEFPSDVFILLESVGAKLAIASSDNEEDIIEVSPADYLYQDMNKKIILNVILPILDPNCHLYRSFKIMPRAQNAHAYVNAGFLIQLDEGVVQSARLCFGGIDPSFVHATATEEFLIGKDIHSNEILSEALTILESEIQPDHILPDASSEYRKNLAVALFYKFVLSTCQNDELIGEAYRNGGEILNRGLSSGYQNTSTKQESWPLTKDVPKVDGLVQSAGEAQYITDLPSLPNQLWAAFVPASVVHAKIVHIDTTEALKIPGVHSFFSAKDIPGKNNFAPLVMMTSFAEEEIFVGQNSSVLFNGQPCGVILAESYDLANYAATKVNIIYGDKKKKPILTSLKDAYALNDDSIFISTPFGKEATEYGSNTTKKISGKFEVGSQFHYTMEPHITVCIPSEHGLEVYTGTQWLDCAQVAIAEALDIPNNSLQMVLRRIGGGYGVKFTRSPQIACACALASYLTNRPVRFVMSLESNMTVIGKRYPCRGDYEVEINDQGIIQRLKHISTHDLGASINDNPQFHVGPFMRNCYIGDSFDVETRAVLTNTPCNTFCRAPGTTETIAIIENIMEHIAWETGQNPVDVRLANISDDNKMKEILPDFLTECHYYKRYEEIEEFNKGSRWLKRGIAVVPMEYHQGNFGSITVHVSIYHADGTVAVTHGGTECGQGIHTKVAQVTAHSLGIPFEDVRVKEIDNMHGANSFGTAGSITSESVCFAVKKACSAILERMAPIREELGEDATWKEITATCYARLIDLTAKSRYHPSELTNYTIWGVSCAEVEVDILTGNLQLNRVDILEDTGESMSPGIDVGQVEGAFIMGVGYWLNEAIIYDQKNGELLTNRTWTYKPPGAKDIPIDFRVTFLKHSANEAFILRSKATGEPSLCMSVVTIFALRQAIESARRDAGISEWFELGAPTTPETVFLSSGNSISDYKLT